jgi:HEAT repeat protein
MAGWYILAFLRKTNSGAFAIAVPSGGIVEYSWARPLTPPTETGLSLLQRDIARALKGSDLNSLRRALAMLSEFDVLDAETFRDLTAIKDQPDADSKILRLIALAKFNRAAKTPESVAAGSILRELGYALKARGDSPPPNVAQVAFAIANDGTVSDLSALEDITTSPIPYIRRSAMRGIRKLGTPKSVPFLVAQMRSADIEVKYLAVITLAEIVSKNGQFAPAMDLFERDPERYTALWAAWWTTDGAKYY